MRNSLTRALAIAAALVAGAPVFAQDEVRTMTVKYGDLDLSHADGRAALDRRVANAAKRVCGVENSRDLDRMLRERRCATAAVAGARRAVLAAVERQSATRFAQASIGSDAAVR